MSNDDITCLDKIEANILIKIKFDPKTLRWYVKKIEMAHDEKEFSK